MLELSPRDLKVGQTGRANSLLMRSPSFIAEFADPLEWRSGQAVFRLDLPDLVGKPFELDDAVYAAIFTRQILAGDVTINLPAFGAIVREKAQEITE